MTIPPTIVTTFKGESTPDTGRLIRVGTGSFGIGVLVGRLQQAEDVFVSMQLGSSSSLPHLEIPEVVFIHNRLLAQLLPSCSQPVCPQLSTTGLGVLVGFGVPVGLGVEVGVGVLVGAVQHVEFEGLSRHAASYSGLEQKFWPFAVPIQFRPEEQVWLSQLDPQERGAGVIVGLGVVVGLGVLVGRCVGVLVGVLVGLGVLVGAVQQEVTLGLEIQADSKAGLVQKLPTLVWTQVKPELQVWFSQLDPQERGNGVGVGGIWVGEGTIFVGVGEGGI